MTNLVFVHGWGFDASFWDGVRWELNDIESQCVDIGYFSFERLNLPAEAVYVTHSMGLAWCLQQETTIKGLVVCNGFTKFCASDDWQNGVAERMLSRMIRQFERAPEKVWVEFMKNCGTSSPEYPAMGDVDLMKRGLMALQSWDVRDDYKACDCPKLVLASQKDEIVPENLTTASFTEDVIWYKEGNHLLPLFETQSVAQHIRTFLDQFS